MVARMNLITRSDAPTFDAEGTTFTGYAAPSRGAAEVSLWEVELPPGTTSPRHHMDREEIFLGIAGEAVAEVDGVERPLGAGDCLILAPGTDFTLRVCGDQPFRTVACVPVGAQATMADDGATFVPPWVA